MSSAARADIQPRLGLRQSRRLLRLAGDDRLVQQIRRGSEAAFEVAFERHSPAILGFCRHMLGSPEEAEDAVQHTFAAAYGDLQRGGERDIALKPWLFTIARNRCLSLLRARREQAVDAPELVTRGLAEEVEERADLRRLLADVRELPDEQREALLLAETAGLPQAEIADILGCEVARVKGLVYRARSALVARREARELACEDVRQQLANLRGGALRRNELRLHLHECEGCRDFREQVRHQRSLLSVALPVVPTLGLKSNVLAAVGIGGAGGGAAAAGGTAAGSAGVAGSAAAGGAAAGGAAGGVAGGAAGVGALGGAAKVAAVAALAIGGVGGGAAVVVSQQDSPPPARPAAGDVRDGSAAGGDRPAVTRQGDQAVDDSTAAPHRGRGSGAAAPHRRGAEQSARSSHGARGRAERESKPNEGRGRGPIETPAHDPPVRRGPPEPKAKPEHGTKLPKLDGQGPAAKEQHAPAATEGKRQADAPVPRGRGRGEQPED